jgi:predicted transcriptional regulator
MDDPAQRLLAGRLMPNVRGDKRRTIVIPDDLWDALYRYAAVRGQSNGAVIRDQIRELVEDAEASDDTADAADA